MTDNFDRRLTPRDPPEKKVPKEGDTFGVPKVNDYGEVTGWDKYHIDSIGYDIGGIVFGVVPDEDDSTTYEIVWDNELNGWVQDGARA